MLATVVLCLCALPVVTRLLVVLVRVCIRQPFQWKVIDSTGQPQWAVVTGCTDGTGFELARQLALKGYSLMLLSRSEPKLTQVRQQILAEVNHSQPKRVPAIQIRTLTVDFRHLDIYPRIEQFLTPNLNHVYVLANNVGICAPMPEHFVNESSEEHQDLINVNVVCATKMLELILPSMVSGNKGGLVLNVSSVAGRHLFPLACTYAATKAYVGHLSECLAVEYRPNQITFHTLYPSAISTKMIYHAKRDAMTASPEEYVRSVLSSVRYDHSCHWTGIGRHTLLELFIDVTTLLLSKPVAGQLIQFCTDRYRSLIVKHQTLSNDIPNGMFNMWNVLNEK